MAIEFSSFFDYIIFTVDPAFNKQNNLVATFWFPIFSRQTLLTIKHSTDNLARQIVRIVLTLLFPRGETSSFQFFRCQSFRAANIPYGKIFAL